MLSGVIGQEKFLEDCSFFLSHDQEATKLLRRFTDETFYDKEAVGKLYYQLRDLKKCLESIYLSQTADQEYLALRKELTSKQDMLERAKQGEYIRFDPPADFVGLINEILNVVEICSGMPMRDTIKLRETLQVQLTSWGISKVKESSELSKDQKKALIDVLGETLTFCEKRQTFFSLHTVFPTQFEIDRTALPAIIWMARAIDELRGELSRERVANMLSASMPPESADEIYKSVFHTPSHFKGLLEQYKKIQRQESITSGTTPVASEEQQLTYAEAAARRVDTQEGSLLQEGRANVALYGQSFCKKIPDRKEEGSGLVRNQRRYDYYLHPSSSLEVKHSQFAGNKRQPHSLTVEEVEEEISLQNRFESLQVEEKEAMPVPSENEPSTASTSKPFRSRKGKTKQEEEDEDEALERAIREREAESLKQLGQEVATKQKIDIRSLIEEMEKFATKHISGKGRDADYITDYSTMVLDYLEVERLVEQAREVRREKPGTQAQQRKVEGFYRQFLSFKGSFERSMPDFFGGRDEGEIKESLRRIAFVMKELHAAGKLRKDFISNIEGYCKKLCKKFDEAEKEYLVSYNKPLPEKNETDEYYVAYVWHRSDICQCLVEIEEMLAERIFTSEDARKLFCYLEKLMKDCSIEEKNLSFLDKLEGNESRVTLEARYTDTWRWIISRYSPPVAKLLLTKVDADACNTALLGACGDNRALEQPQIQARSDFIKVLLADQRADPNITRSGITRDICITWEAEHTPLLLACAQADSERVQLILEHPKMDPNVLIKGQPALWYLFHETWQDKNPEEMEKIMQLLVQDPRTTYSPELLSYIEASPNLRLKEAFMEEYNLRAQTDKKEERPSNLIATLNIRLKEAFIEEYNLCAQTDKKEERRSNPIATLNQMLEGVDLRSTEEREERVRAFSSPRLTLDYDSQKERERVTVVQEEKKEKGRKIRLGSRSI